MEPLEVEFGVTAKMNTWRGEMKLRSLLLCVLFIMGTAGQVYGQGRGVGTILGTISDSSAAIIAKAKVTVTNTATNINQVTESNDDGNYAVPYLRPGTYRVTVEAAGFQKTAVDNINLAVDQNVRVDVVMKAGTVTETVTVNASTLALDTDTSAISQTIGNTQVENLPLQDRNFTQFLLLGAGAVETTGEQGSMRVGKGNAISINGARPTSNNYTLDGLVNTDTALNTPAVILSIDAMQEFKEQTSTYSAEYGFSANQVNIVSKSGGNDLHGSLFWFGRNDALDAQTPFSGKNSKLRQNQFGFVASGPAYLPKLYNGRNKTFWLANYEGWRTTLGTTVQGLVGDPAQLSGDFSASGLPAYGSAACTTALASNLPCMPIDPTTGAPFPGNKIPSTSLSRLAKTSLAQNIFPAPNCTACGAAVNFREAVNAPTTQNQQTYKLDQDLGRFGRIFGRGTLANYTNSNAGGTVSIPFGNGSFVEKETSWTVGHTINIGSHLVNQARYGQLEATANQCSQAVPQSVIDAIGFTGVYPNLSDCARSYPGITLNPTSRVGGPVNDTTLSNIPTREIADSLTLIHGRQTLTMGVDYRHWIQKRNLNADYLGDFTYRNDLILQNGSSNGFIPGPQNGCPTPACGTGNSIADFLLGYYQSVGAFLPGPFSKAGQIGNLNQYHFSYFAPFVQDDWKVSSRLTLNLGLRWDFRTVPFEESNKMGWLDTSNPDGGLCIADPSLVTKGIAPPGSMYRYCGRRNPADGSKKPFAPRFGFAYRPFGGDKTVIRGGYGIFFDSSEGREIDDSGDIYPYAVRAAVTPATQPVASAPKLSDQIFIANNTISPVTPAQSTFIAVIISENPKNPYAQQWTLSAQREILKNTTLEVNYLGNKGTHLLTRNNIAQAFAPDPSNITPVASRKPYQNFTGVYIDSEWRGRSNYQSGNIKLEHRSTSLTFQAAYTWSKSLDDKSAAAGIGASGGGFQGFMDNHRPELDYGLSDFDVKSHFVSNFVYELPVGRGKRYLGNANRAADAAIGGWQLGGIITLQKGFPFSINANDANCLLDTPFCAALNRADPVSGQNPNSGFTRSTAEWFNTAAFVQPGPGFYGTTARNYLRGPGFNNWDMSLAKSVALTERMRFQLRLDAFNTFNHPHFNAPNSTIGSPGFGSITTAQPGRILQLGAKFQF